MPLPRVSAKAKGLLFRYRDAVNDKAFQGSRHPSDWDMIDRRHERSREALFQYIHELEKALKCSST